MKIYQNKKRLSKKSKGIDCINEMLDHVFSFKGKQKKTK